MTVAKSTPIWLGVGDNIFNPSADEVMLLESRNFHIIIS